MNAKEYSNVRRLRETTTAKQRARWSEQRERVGRKTRTGRKGERERDINIDVTDEADATHTHVLVLVVEILKTLR